MSIQLHDLHHACLRVLDVDEAAARWSIQFGLTVVAKERGRALLACDSEDYCLELVEDREADHDHTGWELAADCSLETAAAHL
ncbi:MAG: hypothetical protein WCK20_02335, partial [Thermoleophilia bacterium]